MIMHLNEFEQIKDKINTKYLTGCDSSLANLYLLKESLNTSFFQKEEILFRKYDFAESVKGYGFPILLSKNHKIEDKFEAFFKEIKKKEQNSIDFCYFTEEQKNLFDEFLAKKGLSVEWKTNRDDSDYLYLQSDLADLPGSEYQKKRNHVSKFIKKNKNYNFVYFDLGFNTNPKNGRVKALSKACLDRTYYSTLTPQIKEDFLKVAKKWLCELSGNVDNSVCHESKSIEFAINHLSSFDFFGGILYINEKPRAITLASKISEEVIDIHFEKCLADAAKDGGYAMINNLFAKECKNFKYINREEDLGIEGLRKAKLSYKPEIILDKYYGTLIL